jgi:nitroreductase
MPPRLVAGTPRTRGEPGAARSTIFSVTAGAASDRADEPRQTGCGVAADERSCGWYDLPPRFHPAAQLADEIGEVPCIVLALALDEGPADSVVPAVQNLMLAAPALGIGSVPTTLHPSVMARFRSMFGIPGTVGFHFCVPLGYPRGRFGPNQSRPTSETTFLNRWGAAVPWNET